MAAALASDGRANSTCLQSGSGAVSITGTLVQKIVPGPPNYTSVNRGDAPQLRWFIRLEAAVCVVGDAARKADAPDVSDVRVIQLVLPEKTVAKHSGLVGKRVNATGFVSTRQLGGQNAVVLLDVKTIAEK
jgi:hypothetical protein